MNHDDIVSLVQLGINLFKDVNAATHHHHANPVFNTDNLAVTNDLVRVGHKLYQIGSDNQQRNASTPMFTSTWSGNDGVIGFAYDNASGVVALSFPRIDGSGYNGYAGAGKVYSNSIAIIVSGYNRIGDLYIMQGTSDDGYIMELATWSQNYGTTYERFIRTSEWSYS
jgi:hypothetical protein